MNLPYIKNPKKADTVKEILGFLRTLIGIVIVAEFSLIAWIILNYDKASGIMLSLSITALVILEYLSFVFTLQWKNLLKKLEEL